MKNYFNESRNCDALVEQNTKAYLLLRAIVSRAKRTKEPSDLKIGQAKIGDFAKYGLNQNEYRSAKRTLSKMNLCRFKGIHGIGTIATLLDGSSEYFDINPELPLLTAEQFDGKQPLTDSKTECNESKFVCKSYTFSPKMLHTDNKSFAGFFVGFTTNEKVSKSDIYSVFAQYSYTVVCIFDPVKLHIVRNDFATNKKEERIIKKEEYNINIVQDCILNENENIEVVEAEIIEPEILTLEPVTKNQTSILNNTKNKKEKLREKKKDQQQQLTIEIEAEPTKEKNWYKKALLINLNVEELPKSIRYYAEKAKEFQTAVINNTKNRGLNPTMAKRAKGAWIDNIRLMIEDDEFTTEELNKMIKYFDCENTKNIGFVSNRTKEQTDFWRGNISSTFKLRKQANKVLELANEYESKDQNTKQATETSNLIADFYNEQLKKKCSGVI